MTGNNSDDPEEITDMERLKVLSTLFGLNWSVTADSSKLCEKTDNFGIRVVVPFCRSGQGTALTPFVKLQIVLII